MALNNPLILKNLNHSNNLANTINTHIGNTNNPHNVTKSQVGLSNVDNTADTDKPISNDTQNALNNKLDKNAFTGDITVVVDVDFNNSTTTKKKISYTDGQITNVVAV